MADQTSPSKETAAKDRSIRHMNADHQQSLTYYLQHYAQLSSRASSNPTMLDLSLTSMTLQSHDGRTHTIPLTPPMQSWAEARARLVEMDKTARAALDISPLRITAYEPPSRPLHVVLFGFCFFAYVLFFVARSWFAEDTWVYGNVLQLYFPGGAEGFFKVVRGAAVVLFVLHVGEAYVLDRWRLRKYGLRRGEGVWWMWIASCLVEGFACFQRIDDIVRRKAVEAEKVKH